MSDPTAQRVTLEAGPQDFYEDQECKGNSPATLRDYQTTLRRFQHDNGIVYLNVLDEAHIRGWLVSHRTISRATLAAYDRCVQRRGRSARRPPGAARAPNQHRHVAGRSLPAVVAWPIQRTRGRRRFRPALKREAEDRGPAQSARCVRPDRRKRRYAFPTAGPWGR